jgi:hypothetical protein
VAKLTNHFANGEITVLTGARIARLSDANLPNCSHWYTVKRPKIAHDGTTITGLARNTLGRAISPRTFTSAWIFLGRSFFRPLERCPYYLASLSPERAQWTATVHRDGRLLGWSLRVCNPNSSEAQHRSSRNCEPPGLDHCATLLVTFQYVNRAIRNLYYPSTIFGRRICDDGPGMTGGSVKTTFQQTSPPMRMRGPHRPSKGRRDPRRTSGLTSTAPWRGSLGDELLLIGLSPKLQIPSALEDDHDPGLVEWRGAQLEDKFGDVLPVSARDLEAAGPDILHEDGHGNA